MKRQIVSEPETTKLQSFIVFDGVMPLAEGSEPAVFFTHLPQESNNKHFAVNQVGLLLTFIRFAQRFSDDLPCDYIRTSSHETSLLELDNQVWISVQRQISPSMPSNRNLLHSILQSCKRIYKLFFQLPERDKKTAEVTPTSVKILQHAFQMIVDSITWADLGFIHLFDSFFQLKLDDVFSSQMYPIIQNILTSNTHIAHIAIMYSKYFIFYTFPTDIARTLAICLRMKLPYLFPRVLVKEEERLYWIIGLSMTNRKSCCIYAPPLYIDGKKYPLIALRMKKLRFIMTLKDDITPMPDLLQQIPPVIRNLRKHCEKLKFKSNQGRNEKSGSFVVLKNYPQETMLTLCHEKLSDQTIPIIENMIFQSHTLATDISLNKANVVFPGPANLGYYICLRRSIHEEVVVICQCLNKEVSQAVNKAADIAKNVKLPQVTV